VPIDRAATLRSAEKLLRQGKLDQAITEYVRIVDEQPHDWNTANIVGDLYVRSGKTDKAIEQFVRSADALSDEGVLAKAAALYKKILKLRPEHEHALLQCGEIAATQGVLVDARTFLKSVADRRQARGDRRGVAQIAVRLASLDPQDFAARLEGARARLELKDQAGAVRDLKELAGELRVNGRAQEAIDALREAVTLMPEDQDLRHELLEAFVAAGDHVSAREHARTSEQLQLIAAHFEEQGRHEEAVALLEQALAIDPSDARLLKRLNRAPVVDAARHEEEAPAEAGVAPESGETETAVPEVDVPAASAPSLDSAAAFVAAGRAAEALAVVRQFIESAPGRRDEVTLFGLSLCDSQPDLAFAVIDLAADAAVSESDWASAAAGLQELVTRVPMYLPALMRLVEVSVDGGLEAAMFSAQAQLVDAYLEAGAAEEARYIAEDLVAREPWDRANIERFRRALEMLGEPNPEACIAARLSGDEPFTSTDVSISAARGEVPTLTDAADAADEPVRLADEELSASAEWQIDNHNFDFAATPFDYSSSSFDSPESTPEADVDEDDPAEVDLSVALDGMTPPEALTETADAPPATIDGVLGELRAEAERKSDLASAEDEFARGVGLHAIGRLEDSIPLLTSASRAPRLRFATASLLGRIYLQQGQTERAVEWLERAAQAPPTSQEEGHLLLYDLADVLETSGEYTRALAVCMELQADAGDYRDIAERVSRLRAAQMRG
jgi:tetratricopeptide (TPR) repeat protein